MLDRDLLDRVSFRSKLRGPSAADPAIALTKSTRESILICLNSISNFQTAASVFGVFVLWFRHMSRRESTWLIRVINVCSATNQSDKLRPFFLRTCGCLNLTSSRRASSGKNFQLRLNLLSMRIAIEQRFDLCKIARRLIRRTLCCQTRPK